MAAALLGAWALTWGFSSLGVVLLVALGQPYAEAHMAVMLLAFLLMLAAFCWAFIARRLWQVWAVLAGGGGAMTTAAWWLQQQLI